MARTEKVQASITEETDERLDRLAEETGLDRASIARYGLHDKLDELEDADE